MHRGIVLLAACAHLIKAGPVPYHGAIEQHHNVPRFLNMTGLEPSKTEAISSIISTSSDSLTSSSASHHDSTVDGFLSATRSQIAASTSSVQAASVVATSSALPSKGTIREQIEVTSGSTSITSNTAPSSNSIESLSTSKVSSISSQALESVASASTSSTSFNINDLPPTSTSSSVSLAATELTSKDSVLAQSETSIANKAASPVADTTKSQSTTSAAIIINAVGSSDASASALSTSASLDASTQSSATVASATSSPPTDQQIASISANALAAAATKSADASASSVSASASAAGATASSANLPTADGNLAMASGYNKAFKSLSQTSTCNPKDNSAATACIDGQPATCEVDGTYTLESCPQGQSCFAVPNSGGQSGVTVGCYVPSVAAAKLAAGGQSASVAISSSPSGVDTVASQTTAAADINTEASQAIDVPSTTAAVTAGASPTSEAPITKPETTSLQPPPPENVQLLPTSSAPVSPSAAVVASPQHKAAGSQPTLEATAQSSDSPQTTLASIENSQQSFPESSAAETASAVFPINVGHKPASSAAAAASSAAGLVLSFPSDLPSSAPATPTRTAQASETTPAGLAAAEQKDSVSTADSIPPFQQVAPTTSASPSATPSTPLDNGLLANIPATPSSSPATSPTTNANAAGITIIPESNSSSSGQATVTVTVTMTIHDHN